jgi:hypothetical protein
MATVKRQGSMQKTKVTGLFDAPVRTVAREIPRWTGRVWTTTEGLF